MKLSRLFAFFMSACLLGGCGNTLDRLSNIGKPPPLTAITNPIGNPGYVPVELPMPQKISNKNQAQAINSLWEPSNRGFFKDNRASNIGDILTVIVNIDGQRASLSNSTERDRETNSSGGLSSFFGLENIVKTILPQSDPAKLVGVASSTDLSATGTINRQETINIRFAALVVQILPNGNMVINGRQEVRVNTELRQLHITGVIRPTDIISDNTITADKIAEARISYGGRGTISDIQGPQYGQEFLDIVFPF